MAYTIPAVLFIKMNNCFGVALGAIVMALRLQLLPQLRVIVDFPVEDDPNRSIFIANGLVPGSEVHDAQPPHAKPYAARNKKAIVVRPSVRHRRTHLAEPVEFYVRLAPEFQNS